MDHKNSGVGFRSFHHLFVLHSTYKMLLHNVIYRNLTFFPGMEIFVERHIFYARKLGILVFCAVLVFEVV